MAAIVKSFAISGVDGYLVEVEAETIYGQPSIAIVGLGEQLLKRQKRGCKHHLTALNFSFPR